MEHIIEALESSVVQLHGCGAAIKLKQRDAVLTVLRRQDTLAVLPTGFGKSLLCYVLPRLVDFLRQRVDPSAKTIVLMISPLITLMEDQVARMRALDVAAIHWHSGLPQEEREREARGEFEVVLLSPEACETSPCRALLNSSVYQKNVK